MTKQKITIIGGGIGGLTAAYELTDPKLQNKYDITLYQMGWRLGGKCATGRNQDRNMRIEEHGIHAFAGSYYNGLTMMKNCLLYTSPSPRDRTRSRMPSSA